MANGISFETAGPIATIALDRPDASNAFTIAMARELMEVAMRCEDDDRIRCVVLTGRGRFFCAGGDIQAFSGAGDQLPIFLREITSYLHGAISALMRMNKPLVCGVNGPVAGGGVGLAIAGDIVLADPAAHFTLAYTGIGMSPDGGSSWLLPRLIGLRRAQELCLTNRRVGAVEAAELGLVTRVVQEGQLAAELQATAGQLATSATTALGAARRLLLESFSNSLESQMELESRTIAAQGASAEGREGVSAFIEKRKPRFVEDD